MKKITKPIKVHGGKEYLADWIISLMPPRCENPNAPDPKDKGWLHFVETHAGGASVSLAMDPEGISEVWNDLNDECMNLFEVIRRTDNFPEFRRLVNSTQFSQKVWQGALRDSTLFSACRIKRAVRFFILNRQSHSGRMKDFAAITRNRTRRGMNEQVSAWFGAIDGLDELHERLLRVLIVSDYAERTIRRQDGERTLFYLDPPYLHSTRAAKAVYGKFEMSERAHAILLAELCSRKPKSDPPLTFTQFERLDGKENWFSFMRAWQAPPLLGRFLLSGYRSRLYDLFAKHQGWKRHEKKIDNKSAGGKTKRIMTECVWTNY